MHLIVTMSTAGTLDTPYIRPICNRFEDNLSHYLTYYWLIILIIDYDSLGEDSRGLEFICLQLATILYRTLYISFLPPLFILTSLLLSLYSSLVSLCSVIYFFFLSISFTLLNQLSLFSLCLSFSFFLSLSITLILFYLVFLYIILY